MWLKRALIRRTRAVNNRPCLRQLTTTETARLNSINFIARDLNPVPEDTGSTALPDDFERCTELRRWCLSHSGERPRLRSHNKKETSLASWLAFAKTRRARPANKFTYGRQLTTKETAHLNSILRATVAPIRVGHVATTSKLDTKSSWSVLRERCWELGLTSYGDKQVLLARILNEENSLTTDSQVKDSDNDQEMLGTFRDTDSLPIMDHMP